MLSLRFHVLENYRKMNMMYRQYIMFFESLQWQNYKKGVEGPLLSVNCKVV